VNERAPEPAADALKDLELLIRSKYAVIRLDTEDEDRARILLKHLADRLEVPFFVWSRTKGLRRDDDAAEQAEDPLKKLSRVYGSLEPSAALAHAEGSEISAIYQFEGLGAYLGDKIVASRLKDASRAFTQRVGAIVLTGPVEALPEELKASTAVFRLPAPAPEEYRALLEGIIQDLSQRMTVRVVLTAAEVDRLLENLKGLTLMEAGKILTKGIVEDGVVDAAALRGVLEAKKAIIERDGLLEYSPTHEQFDSVASLEGLKGWLAKRKELIVNPRKGAKFGLSFPRGVLLLGVQGCGKSLCAKAVAAEWGLPLLRLDPSSLYNKFFGESEKNFQRAIKTAEKLAPVVLWIDEIEKAFAQGSNDDGTSQRILGTFLNWLQDRKGEVFVVATANDIARLPPEFIRKGRFDEIFFVDLPDAPARRAIFRIHLAKRGQDVARFDLEKLVAATSGYSGAEIEQAVVSGLYTAFSADRGLDTELVLQEVMSTLPLSQTMKEKVESLREWARTRTVSAQ
jgi:AAA+ superfamily predicted ATPase